jgi:hypothetical protein
MERPHYSFADIISLNSNDWDKAYVVLQACLESGHLIKEIRGFEDIIYIPANGILDHHLVHDPIMPSDDQPKQSGFRKRMDF